MKIASRVLLVIGAVVSIIVTIIFVILSIQFFNLASPENTNAIIEGLRNGTITTTFPGTNQEKAAAIQMTFGIFATVYLIFAILTFFNFIIALASIGVKRKGAMIANIVFGFLSMMTLNAIAGILGLIALSREKSAPKEVDPLTEI